MPRSTRRNALAFAALVFASVGGRVPVAHAQTQGARPAPNQQQTQATPQPTFTSSIDVVGVTPIAGLGVNRDKVPTNVLNLDARMALSRRLELFGNVANLTNAEYDTFGLLGEADDVLGDEFDDPRFVSPGAPRAAWVGLRLRF